MVPSAAFSLSLSWLYGDSSSDASSSLFTRSIRLRRCRFDISFTHTAILAKFPRQLNSSALLYPSGFLTSLSLLTTEIRAPAPRHLFLWFSPCPSLFEPLTSFIHKAILAKFPRLCHSMASHWLSSVLLICRFSLRGFKL